MGTGSQKAVNEYACKSKNAGTCKSVCIFSPFLKNQIWPLETSTQTLKRGVCYTEVGSSPSGDS